MSNSELQIIKLDKNDLQSFQKLVRIFNEVFELGSQNYVSESHLRSLLENPYFIAFVIQNENEILGGLTAYELPQYHSENAELFLYDLAIKQKFQRKDFGKNLQLKLEEYCREKDIKIFFVAAHEEDTNAIDFYHSTGGQAEKVVHFNYKVN